MATLYVYLTDGFNNDRVAVSVDGRRIFDQGGVTTRKLIGLAKQLGPITVAGDTAELDIELPEKRLRTHIRVDLSKGSHVPIALVNGQFSHSVERQIGFG